MKNRISFFIAVITLSFIFNFLTQSSSEAGAIGCLKNADGSAIMVKKEDNDDTPFALAGTTVFDQDACSQEPDEYKIKFFRVALCTDDPYKGAADPDFSTCSNIFNNAAGTEKTIEPDTETDLLTGDLILPIGTYPYLIVIVDNHLNIKHKQKYVLNSDGSTAFSVRGQGGTDDADLNGSWCWTRAAVTTYTGFDASGGDDHPTDYDTLHSLADGAIKKSGSDQDLAQLSCKATEPADADVVFATEIIDDLESTNPDVTSFVRHIDYFSALDDTGIAGIEMAQNLLLADSVSIATTASNARRLMSHFKYASPVVISENTVGFKLRFSTFSSVSIDMAVDTDADPDVTYAAKVGGDPFMVQVQTKTKRRRGSWR